MWHNWPMATTTVGMRELHLSTRSVLEMVRKVGTAIITDRGEPVARIIAIDEEEAELLKAGATAQARPRFTMPTRAVPEGQPTATEVLLAAREDDRL